ncbi:MAG: tRNA (adenosine(37)-N6)-threonylcarbamoyltransferase complex ATPase subunit type 1 TsaE, partial [Clostridium sp.]
MIIRANSEEETIILGERIGKHLKPGDIITLNGDLGAGKTHFTKGIAKGLSVDD